MKSRTVQIRWIASGALLAGVLCGSARESLQSVAIGGSPSGSRFESVSDGNAFSLQTLQKKAGERDLYLARMRELQKRVDLLTGRNDHMMLQGGGKNSAFGQLSRLKEKATLVEKMEREVEKIRLENKHLQKQNEQLLAQVDSSQEKLIVAQGAADDLQRKNEQLKEKNKGLRATISRLLLGEFEYYEVKTGETLQTIAANPMIYGDASRASWLRQANEERVPNINHLRDGDMLIVPRFPRTGSYEF